MTDEPTSGRSRPIRDLLLILAVSAASLVILDRAEAVEAFHRFSRSHPDWKLEEVVLTLVLVLALCLGTLALRRRTESSGRAGGPDFGRLSGTLSRGAGQEILDFEIQRSKRYQRPLSLVLCDVDRLQEITSRHGKSAGDRTVAEIGRIIQEHLRSTDLLVHWGEDEFLVLCIESDLEAARKTAERLRGIIENHRSGDLPCAVTASFGVVQLRNEEALAPLLERIDSQLRRAKDHGRNRLAVSGSPA